MGKLCKLLKKFPLELCGATDGLGGGGVLDIALWTGGGGTIFYGTG